MKRRSRLFLAGLILLGTIATGHDADAQGLPNVIEGFFPTQLAAGQGNVLHLGIPGRGEVTAVEINPAAGITVKDIKRGDVREGSLFWEVTVEHVPEGMAHREVIRWQDIPAAEEVLGIVRWSRS